MSSNVPNGVMLNAYPDSIGRCLSDAVDMLKRPEFEDAFSLFYILPTFFNSDLDRGFSVVDYRLNRELVQPEDLQELDGLGVNLKFDLVLNHLSVGSPQFRDLLENGDDSPYKDFFIDWNLFWQGHGEMGPDGYIIPAPECLDVLFMRKPGLPILKVRFPDGSERPYWNTFYQEVTYQELALRDLIDIPGIGREEAWAITHIVNDAIRERMHPGDADWGDYAAFREPVLALVEQTRKYLGQMDLNAKSEKVWAFYDETLGRLREFGAKLVRLDAFAYLHKEPGKRNFFNKPGTWEYLDRLKGLADNHGLTLLPEIHSEYGLGLHEEVAARGFVVYDFFFPGLVIDALHRGINRHLLRWIRELLDKNILTVNMLGCHDGIPVLDLRGNHGRGGSKKGLLSDREIDAVIDGIMAYGGRVKNLYGADGKKIAYYQVNATFFSALGEDESRLRLARAIQMFMPGIPQVWYLDLFAGKNDYEAADKGGTGGHKEINRTTLENSDIEQGLKRLVVQDQLELIRLRNTFPAFGGELTLGDTDEHHLHMSWKNRGAEATLKADLRTSGFTIDLRTADGEEWAMYYRVAADHARKG
jgi:sucrose phosphorylase